MHPSWMSSKLLNQFSTKICRNNRPWLPRARNHFPTRICIQSWETLLKLQLWRPVFLLSIFLLVVWSIMMIQRAKPSSATRLLGILIWYNISRNKSIIRPRGWNTNQYVMILNIVWNFFSPATDPKDFTALINCVEITTEKRRSLNRLVKAYFQTCFKDTQATWLPEKDCESIFMIICILEQRSPLCKSQKYATCHQQCNSSQWHYWS